MEYNSDILSLIAQGRIEGYWSQPTVVETIISRVFLFREEGKVFKVYKRDNAWWNSDMQNLSGGQTRIDFISGDFYFNQELNPDAYTKLYAARVVDGQVVLGEPDTTADELVIGMNMVDMSQTLTRCLSGGTLSDDDFESIGIQIAKTKQTLGRKFMMHSALSWYEQLLPRMRELENWIQSASGFPEGISTVGMAEIRAYIEDNREEFSRMHETDLVTQIDCNSENILYQNSKLVFMDAYPPKESWRIGPFETDMYRIGGDILILSGQEAYDRYMKGVLAIIPECNRNHERFYLLYGMLISGPYFYHLSQSNSAFATVGQQYVASLERFLQRS